MTLEQITIAPTYEEFTLLSNHQSQTPGTFYGGKPVLHLYCPDAALKAQKQQLQSQAAIAALEPSLANAQQANGSGEDDTVFRGVDVWVTSKYLALWSTLTARGVRIPYQTITITAQDGDAVLLELNFTDRYANDTEDIEFMQMRILPGEVVTREKATQQATAEGTSNGQSAGSASQQLWQAIFDCQELNPDPIDEDEEEEGEGGLVFDETAPGATGWITAENMHEYVDEEGNLRIPEGAIEYGEDPEEDSSAQEQLGEGAGRVRTAEEAGADVANAEDTKWRRTG